MANKRKEGAKLLGFYVAPRDVGPLGLFIAAEIAAYVAKRQDPTAKCYKAGYNVTQFLREAVYEKLAHEQRGRRPKKNRKRVQGGLDSGV
jgi:hypothetical protein